MNRFFRVRMVFDAPLSDCMTIELRAHLFLQTYSQQTTRKALGLPVEALLATGVTNVSDEGERHETTVIDTVVELSHGGAADAVTVIRHAVCSVMASDHIYSAFAKVIT